MIYSLHSAFSCIYLYNYVYTKSYLYIKHNLIFRGLICTRINIFVIVLCSFIAQSLSQPFIIILHYTHLQHENKKKETTTTFILHMRCKVTRCKIFIRLFKKGIWKCWCGRNWIGHYFHQTTRNCVLYILYISIHKY